MSVLFEEMEIGSLRAKNRLVRAATYEALADDGGHMTPELTAIYEELADGGVGTIIVGYARVMRNEQPNPRMLGIYDDSFVPEFRALTDMAHAHGTAIVSQIVYGGSATKLQPPSRRILGPSAVANPKTGIVPVEATVADLHELAQAFADAAARAQTAGFDGVELHAAHGCLLSQFLSPLLNRRRDARAIDVPVILTGGNRSFEAMDRLAVESEGRIAGFGLCRPLICEPRLAQRWRVDPQAKPRCVSCDKCSTMPGHRCILP